MCDAKKNKKVPINEFHRISAKMKLGVEKGVL
jgi:hypothetical protein